MIGRLSRAFAGASVAFVLLLIVCYTSPLIPALARWLTGQWEQPRGDVLIVLGADQLDDGTPGVVSYWRSLYAARAFRSGGFHRVVVSGGRLGDSGSVSVARAMVEVMISMGVPRDVVSLEEQSMSTRENALFTAKMIQGWPGTRVLLTSDIHMRRAHAAFARAGVSTIPAPIPDVGKRWNYWPQRWDCIWDVGFALLKYPYYAARGWI